MSLVPIAGLTLSSYMTLGKISPSLIYKMGMLMVPSSACGED